MSGVERYVPTNAIRDAVTGREADILNALGIPWSGGSTHIFCPYPDHPDRDPSWRWDDKRKVAFCTCIGSRPGENKGHSIFGVVAAKEGLNREAAKMRVAEIIARPDPHRHGKQSEVPAHRCPRTSEPASCESG
jgi:hypothetical protein